MSTSRNTETSAMRIAKPETVCAHDTRQHILLLGHEGHGVTELRTFEPIPLVAYIDNVDDAVRLCQQVSEKCSGIYVGVQPRPAHLFDLAPNCWRPARSKPSGNCACDDEIEYITAAFFDIDAISEERRLGHPASEEELQRSLNVAQMLSNEDGLALSSVICSSGNGNYVLAPIAPIPVDSDEIATKFKRFCEQLAQKVAGRVSGVKIDPVYNLSRVMRLMGTWNRKGHPAAGRPHRRAHSVTELPVGRSMALYYTILSTDVELRHAAVGSLATGIHCDLKKLEHCEFIRWSRSHAIELSEPLWWALITNLAHLEGGIDLIHELSRLDPVRYDYANTQHKVQKAIDAGYRPVLCKTIVSEAIACPERWRFRCSQLNRCPARTPMYMAVSHAIYRR